MNLKRLLPIPFLLAVLLATNAVGGGSSSDSGGGGHLLVAMQATFAEPHVVEVSLVGRPAIELVAVVQVTDDELRVRLTQGNDRLLGTSEVSLTLSGLAFRSAVLDEIDADAEIRQAILAADPPMTEPELALAVLAGSWFTLSEVVALPHTFATVVGEATVQHVGWVDMPTAWELLALGNLSDLIESHLEFDVVAGQVVGGRIGEEAIFTVLPGTVSLDWKGVADPVTIATQKWREIAASLAPFIRDLGGEVGATEAQATDTLHSLAAAQAGHFEAAGEFARHLSALGAHGFQPNPLVVVGLCVKSDRDGDVWAASAAGAGTTFYLDNVVHTIVSGAEAGRSALRDLPCRPKVR